MNSTVSRLALGLAVALVLVYTEATNGAAVMDEQETPSLVKNSDISAQLGIDMKYTGRRITLMPLSQNLTQRRPSVYY
ncbi:uncharacterized protein LOC111073270 isoform X2 [Drosophila obscura]|uniref:uncharacterized protein LOC111073270 isoform X2 n=1 Tax=Drosophila obscura TaxID=7282 RepID=UPI001BB13803|nr:uncharacterized protein LOC111073270 isoform X2 [Drosophila obscura]